MRYSIAVPVIAGLAAALPQGVTEQIAPDAAAPGDCSPDYSGEFQITVQNVTETPQKRDLLKRQTSGVLTLTLAGGILTDQADRTGYVASNFQFQFDAPPQAGAIYTAGFSACGNGSLALGGSTIFYQCYTGGFYNLYDRDWAEQCSPIYLNIINGGDAPPVNELPDGQPQGVTQINDGQVQAPTGAPPVTQIGDGQIQAPTGGAPVTQIEDGQPQAPTGAPVTQIEDGQPQAPTEAAPPPVTQIDDGQIQAPTETPPPVTQIDDGQIQAPTGGNITAVPTPPPQATGAAAAVTYQFGAVVAGVLGFAIVL